MVFFRKNQYTLLKFSNFCHPMSSRLMNVSSRETTHSVTHFILLGFPSSPEMQLLYFGLFSATYILTLMGNTAIVCAVRWDQRLHTPMYIFLGNFSFLEICYVTTTVPNMLADFLSSSKSISFVSCLHSSTSSSLLGVMRASTFASWPLTGILPSAVLCITHAS